LLKGNPVKEITIIEQVQMDLLQEIENTQLPPGSQCEFGFIYMEEI